MLAGMGHGFTRILTGKTWNSTGLELNSAGESRNPCRAIHIRGHPAAIIGTAASAAKRPINLQRLKCSFKTSRASRTVTAG
jgi:hypothetical protein